VPDLCQKLFNFNQKEVIFRKGFQQNIQKHGKFARKRTETGLKAETRKSVSDFFLFLLLLHSKH
jgi:hypothetical protein